MSGTGIQGAVVLAIVALIAFIIGRETAVATRTSWRRFGRPYGRHYYAADTFRAIDDVGRQLNAVMAASFKMRRVLTYPEYRVFRIAEQEMSAIGKGHRVFAQTNLGEILQSPSSNAFHAINSKRVDILVVDRGGWPVLAVEYQGNQHFRGTAAARDAIKKEALRKAGVRYIEISATDDESKIRSQLREQFGWKSDAATTFGRRLPVGSARDSASGDVVAG